MDRYALETARRMLQPMQSADIGAIHNISNEPGVREYLFDDRAVSLACVDEIFQQRVSNFVLRNFGIWTIRKKRMPDVIGFCGLRRVQDLDETEILYALSESHWHVGYAVEAALAVQRYAFAGAGLESLIGIIDVPNLRSWRVLERLGTREYWPLDGERGKRYAIATRKW